MTEHGQEGLETTINTWSGPSLVFGELHYNVVLDKNVFIEYGPVKERESRKDGQF